MFEIILADLQRTVRECGGECKIGPDLVIRDYLELSKGSIAW
jgi:hypothetical protein